MMLGHRKEEALERLGPVFNPPVYIQRYTTVRDILYKHPGIKKVADFGCAEGKFFKYLKKLPFAEEILGVDISESCLKEASHHTQPIAWDFLFKRHRPLSIKLFKGSIAQKDSRIEGCDAVTCIELIEHLESSALLSLPENVFGYIRPKIAIFTTPNSDFNCLFPNLVGFRHWDHKFEWNRDQFSEWCHSIIEKYTDYSVEFGGMGDPPQQYKHLGCCTQMAIFRLHDGNKALDSSKKYATMTYTLVSDNLFPGREAESGESYDESSENFGSLPGCF